MENLQVCFRRLALATTVLAIAMAASLSAHAQTLDKAGNLYGTASFGGAYGYGTVYKITP